MINSTSNKQIRNLIQLQTKAKARREQGLFVVEGIRMYREVPAHLLVKTYVSESFYKKKEYQAFLGSGEMEIVSDRVFASAADTKTPQGILGVVRQQEYTADDVMKGEQPLLLLLEDIQDPGNLGTIFRTAEAAGVTGIIMSGGTVDVYSPKVVRSTMGAVYRMPFCRVKDFSEIVQKLRARSVRTFAAYLQGSREYTSVDYTGGCAVMIGNEGNGLTDGAVALADERVKISMSGQAESLNAAVASAVLMFEARRQRNSNP